MRRFLSWPDPVIKLNKGKVSVKQHSCMSVEVDISVMDDVWSCKPFPYTLLVAFCLLRWHHSVVGKRSTRSSKQNPFKVSAVTLQDAAVVSVVPCWYPVPLFSCCYSDGNAMDGLERAVLWGTGDTCLYYRITCGFVKLNLLLMLSEFMWRWTVKSFEWS